MKYTCMCFTGTFFAQSHMEWSSILIHAVQSLIINYRNSNTSIDNDIIQLHININIFFPRCNLRDHSQDVENLMKHKYSP